MRVAAIVAVGGAGVLILLLRRWRRRQYEASDDRKQRTIPFHRAFTRATTSSWHEITSEAYPKPPVYFVPLSELEAYGSFPRCGSNAEFVHELTGLANANLQRPADTFEASRTVFAFCSHRWINPGNSSRGHPDDAAGSKYEVVLAALRALKRGPASPVPHNFEVAVWVEYVAVRMIELTPDRARARELAPLFDLLH